MYSYLPACIPAAQRKLFQLPNLVLEQMLEATCLSCQLFCSKFKVFTAFWMKLKDESHVVAVRGLSDTLSYLS
jgi:hypothetical protein